jgi:hypothetical protein
MAAVALGTIGFTCLLFANRRARAAETGSIDIKQMVAGWSELERLSAQSEYDIAATVKTLRNDAEPKTEIDRFSVGHVNGCFLVRYGDNEIWGGNPSYVFRLRRTDKSTPWVVSFVGPAGDTSTRNGDDYYGATVRIPWTIFNIPLKEIFGDPTFEGHVATVDPEHGFVTVDFHIASTNKSIRNLAELSRGTVTLDPKYNWAIRSYDVELVPPGKAHMFARVEYGARADNFLRLSHVTLGTDWPATKSKLSGTSDMVYNSSGKCPLSSVDFTMTAFGIPEPVLGGRGVKYWIWFNIIGLLLIVTALAIRWRIKSANAQFNARGTQ